MKTTAHTCTNEHDPATLTKAQRSILLYAECCLVDYGGLLEGIRMNEADLDALKEFQEAGLLRFGRVPGRLLGSFIGRSVTHWVAFAPACWDLVSRLRRLQSERSKTNSLNYQRVRDALLEDGVVLDTEVSG